MEETNVDQPAETQKAERQAQEQHAAHGAPEHHPGKPGGSGLKPLHIAGIAAVVALGMIAVYVFTVGASPQVVAAGDNVSVYYTGSYSNGTIFGSNVGQLPLNFTAGSNQLISGFSDAVIGMRLNQTKNVTVPPSEGYGSVNQSLFVTVPKAQFGNQTITVGEVVSTSTGMQGMITAINATNVTVDFNPPLAGKTLQFQIRVVAIRK